MKTLERIIVREAKIMTRKEVMMKAINKKITWIQAADILGICDRQMRRIKKAYEKHGYDGLRDHRAGRPMRKRIQLETIQEVCRLKEKVYPDFSMKHFHEQLLEKHSIQISYNWMRIILEEAGIVQKAHGRGKHRRKRERRPMRGMLIHIDGSRHAWIPGEPEQDLIVLLDDANGEMLYGQFFEEEGTLSTFSGLEHVLAHYGRFSELYHDRGSHFGKTSVAGHKVDEEQNGQVSRALRALGIRQIFAYSPQARGRGERAFGTIQGRLPQELRLAGITSYKKANEYLRKCFMPSFNKRFTVVPAQAESAFVPIAGIDLKLLLSIQEERVVRNDNTVSYKNLTLQIPPSKERLHYVRCPVMVHLFTDQTIGISYQGKLLGQYTNEGEAILVKAKKKKAA